MDGIHRCCGMGGFRKDQGWLKGVLKRQPWIRAIELTFDGWWIAVVFSKGVLDSQNDLIVHFGLGLLEMVPHDQTCQHGYGAHKRPLDACRSAVVPEKASGHVKKPFHQDPPRVFPRLEGIGECWSGEKALVRSILSCGWLRWIG